ncbi:MAG TPA: polysaccharide biosynthesis/export family protein [Vicinamibacterales bacterium]|nr:polysaccharide biosynthesis/export family protein [Vicinamibacterales bacterium]
MATSSRFPLLVAGILTLGLVAYAQVPVTNYVIGPEDVLTITSFDQEDITGKYQVDADGTFSFPLIGRVHAGGLTLRQLQAELVKRLKEGFFKDPQIGVAVEQYRSQKFHIVGEVRTPGTYPLTGDMNLMEALARAGSATPTAAGEVLIVRAKTQDAADGPTLPNRDDVDVTTIELKALQSGRLAQKFALRDGDTIVVPRAESVYVFGQVRNPGAYPVQKDTTVLQALSLAGGVTDRGATGRIKIVRMIDGKRVEIKAKLDDLVRPLDTIMVPERFF